MIDVENEIFNIISSQTRDEFPGIYITGEYVKSPPSFPCVSLIEMDNSVLRETQSTDSMENHVVVMYEMNVYSNKTKGKKAECKRIASFIDNALIKLNFTRTMLEPTPNQNDATIYRMLGRYRAVIGKGNIIYKQ